MITWDISVRLHREKRSQAVIDYKCIQCGEEMASPESLLGQEEFCPSCGAATRVPGPIPAGEEESAFTEVASSPGWLLPGKGWAGRRPKVRVQVQYDRIAMAGIPDMLKSSGMDPAQLEMEFSEQIGLPQFACANCMKPCVDTHDVAFSTSDGSFQSTFRAQVPECDDCTESRKSRLLYGSGAWLFLGTSFLLGLAVAVMLVLNGHQPRFLLLSLPAGLAAGGCVYGLLRGAVAVMTPMREPFRNEQTTLGKPVKFGKRGETVYFVFTNHEYAKRFIETNNIDEGSVSEV